MITKIGSDMVKEALLGAAIGAVRAGNLSSDERRLLEAEYNLPENASLGWRNAGRGFVGNHIGGLLGAGVGNLLGNKLGPFPAIAGSILGTKLMTDKYSSGRARKIQELRRKPDVSLDLIASRIRQAGLQGDAAKGLLAFYAGNETARKEAF